MTDCMTGSVSQVTLRSSACEGEGCVAGIAVGSDEEGNGEVGNGNVFSEEAVYAHGDEEREA